MALDKKWLGRYGEERACDYLAKSGYQILDRNSQTRAGELDIVASTGKTLVFVEVKTRTSDNAGSPLSAVTPSKLARIRRLAAAWCAGHQVSNVQVRFDAIGVLVRGGRVTIEHLKQVY
ncbi:MAG: YraN family protein [Micrococcales bacterium]